MPIPKLWHTLLSFWEGLLLLYFVYKASQKKDLKAFLSIDSNRTKLVLGFIDFLWINLSRSNVLLHLQWSFAFGSFEWHLFENFKPILVRGTVGKTFCLWLDWNCRPLVSELTVLPIESKALRNNYIQKWLFWAGAMV